MSPADCLLTFDLPRRLEDEVVDVLRTWPQWQGRVQRLRCEVLGQSAALSSAVEKLHGSAQRTQFSLALPAADAAPLVAALQQRLPSPDIHWWLSPVLARGTLA